jgi:hypothetical protein
VLLGITPLINMELKITKAVQTSEEPPSKGTQDAQISNYLELNESFYVVRYEFAELDSKGKPKFAWFKRNKKDAIDKQERKDVAAFIAGKAQKHETTLT